MVFQKLMALCILLSVAAINGNGQCTSAKDINKRILELDQNSGITLADKLARLKILKEQFEECNYLKDSVYAKLLHKVSIIEYEVNGQKVTSTTIPYALQAIAINTSSKKDADPVAATKSYFNVSIFYRGIGLDKASLRYYDTTIQYADRYPIYKSFILTAREERASIFFQQGDYQQSINESSLGLRSAQEMQDSISLIRFLNQRAQSSLFQRQYTEAETDAAQASQYAEKIIKTEPDRDAKKNIYYELANSFKIRALSKIKTADTPEVNSLIEKSISYRIQSGNRGAIADDYNDYGAYFFLTHKDCDKAKTNYLKSLQYVEDSKIRRATARLNLGAAQFVQGNHRDAEKNYLQSLRDISLNASTILENPNLEQISVINQKEFIHVYLNNKTEFLLCRYRETKDRTYLKACLETALLTDSVIKFVRREHTGEQSKLFWRNRTREFFTNALEACFIANDFRLAFYFMESSRAVILADKLNELGAASFLPLTETLQEQNLRESLVREQQTLASAKEGSEEYKQAYYRLLQQQEKVSRFLHGLEKNYPAYYQYKYSETVPALEELKKHLAANQQSFVHYFIGDTISFALGITANNVKMLRIPKDRFQPGDITTFFSFLSNKQLLNTDYKKFTVLSHRLYNTIFEPLKLPKGRVVLCPDNFLLPFEALCTDPGGTKMLIEDYAFSYIYSARYFLRQFPHYPASGNFLGFAPVSFQSYLEVADLRKSAVSLKDVSSNYRNARLFTAAQATKRNFLASIGQYNIVNIFSHARADNTDAEPMLYMQDSTISLSELQYVNRPGTKLIVLSACQTTAGKNATGEGIYSLARGFAVAGIPTVAATMWSADEETIYSITKVFHQHLSRGMLMDEALQKAKVEFMQSANREHLLPYYWANLVLIGKAERIEQDKPRSWPNIVYVALGLLVLASAAYLVIKRRRKIHYG